MKRTQARTLLMQLLFQMSIHNDFSTDMVQKYTVNHSLENQKDYFNSVIEAFIEYRINIDDLIEKSSKNWKLNRISKVELAILRLASVEIIYMEDIPDSVSINEAVELAKNFSSDESGKFVNGILGKIEKFKNDK